MPTKLTERKLEESLSEGFPTENQMRDPDRERLPGVKISIKKIWGVGKPYHIKVHNAHHQTTSWTIFKYDRLILEEVIDAKVVRSQWMNRF